MKAICRQFAFAILALAASSAAQAQSSSAQLSGKLGAAATFLDHQSSGGSLKLLTDHLLEGSWLRFDGTEDLGEGMAAMFRLESGLGIDTGASGGNGAGGAKFWNRQSWVGLRLGAAGSLTFGRQFHAASDRAIRTYDVYNLAGSSLHVTPLALFGVNRFSGNDTRADNSIKYRLSVPGVIEFGASVAAGEGTSGKAYSTDVAHAGANYEIGASYIRFDAPTRVVATGLLPQHKGVGAGGNVKFGAFRPYLAYYETTLDSTTAGRVTQKNKITAWNVFAQSQLKAAYYRDQGTSLNGIAGRDGRKETVVVSAHYFMSKRTSLYATAFENRFTDGYKLETLNIAALGRDPAAGSLAGYSAGITHSF